MAYDFQKSWENVLTSVDVGIRSLVQILRSSEGREFLCNLERGEAGLCIELLDRGLKRQSEPFDQATRQPVLAVLIELSKRRRRLPDSVMITEKTMAEEEAYTSSGSWNVRRGTLNASAIAVKTPKFATTTDIEMIRERFCREVILWNTLSHPNILKLTGVLGSVDTSNFSTVTEWMTHETIMTYLEGKNQNKLELLHGVAQGLKYIHDTNLVHGGVRVSNVLITNESPPRACLSGFGSILDPDQDDAMTEATDASVGVKWRYLAPELIHPSSFGLKGVKPSQEADVYAFGLLVLEVLTGKVPFEGTRGLYLVCSIVRGDRPTKPTNAAEIGLSGSLWELLQACWDGDRTRRPRMQHVEAQIGNAATPGEIPAPSRRSGTKNSTTSDQPQLNIPIIKIDMVEPEEDKSHPMQEFYPPPSPISPIQPGSFSNEATINRVDEILERGSIAEQERARVLNRLCKLCYRHQTAPRSAKIPDCYNDTMTDPVWTGESASVFKGKYKGRSVAIKVLQLYSTNREVMLRKFCKEAVIWRHLRHPNILPLIGVTIGPGRCSMVSDWMDNGTIKHFIEVNPGANRIDLLVGVVKGLMYMHKLPVVHGDLKGDNILISQDGRALLMDFGLSTIIGADTQLDPLDPDLLCVSQRDSLMSFIEGGTYAWMSPELLDHNTGNYRPTKESDIYALGMVIYEVLCGTVPFGDLAYSVAIVVEIMKGTRPAKPGNAASLGFTKELWEVIERCWLVDRNARPTLRAVLSCLRGAAPG